MKTKKSNFNRGFFLSLIVSFSVLGAQSKSFDPNYFLKIGFHEGRLVLTSFIDSNTYFYEDNLLVQFEESPTGTFPIFADDYQILFLNSESTILHRLCLRSKEYSKPIKLPTKVHTVVANENCDTLIYIADGSEYDNLQFYSVEEQKSTLGPKSNYEEFYYSNGWLYYTISISQLKKQVYRSRLGDISYENNSVIYDIFNGHLLFIDPLGNLVTSEFRNSEEEIKIIDPEGNLLETFTPSGRCQIFVDKENKYYTVCP
jgi:hypothetical protein